MAMRPVRVIDWTAPAPPCRAGRAKYPSRSPPAATCKHVGDRPTRMYTEDDQDQYGTTMTIGISHGQGLGSCRRDR
jgi:hypothetical protein